MKTAAVLIEGGAYALSFRRHGRSVWQLKCPCPAGIGHLWQKKKRKEREEDKERNAYALGLAGGGGRGMGAARIAWYIILTKE